MGTGVHGAESLPGEHRHALQRRNGQGARQGLAGGPRAQLGSDEAAGNWLYTPLNDLGGITPAEAVQHTQLDRVKQILADEAQRQKRSQTVVPLNALEGRRAVSG